MPDPPDFARCIAMVRQQLPALAKTSNATIAVDCRKLFQTLDPQVMNFLITARWLQAGATEQHVTVTEAQVRRAFAVQESRQFSTPAQFQSFLRKSGQTRADLLFRVRSQQLALALAEHDRTGQRMIEAQLKRRFHARTICAPGFRTADCAG